MMSDFQLSEALEILERTPRILGSWLEGLSSSWTEVNEGPNTWSAREVVGHLIHGERTDWIPRARQILQGGGHRPFEPFDRFAHLEKSGEKDLVTLLDEFEALRKENLETLRGFQLTEANLSLEGIHPEFGRVTLRQHLAAWVVHDLSHIGQVARVMAVQWEHAVGPWRKYLRILETE